MTAPRDRFAPPDDAAVVKLILEHPLAWVISNAEDDFCASLLPLRPATDPAGRVTALIGHCARSNRHFEWLKREPRALILFLGPHGYISPSWMRDRTQAPTWNYANAQFLVDVEFTEDPATLKNVLDDLVSVMETDQARPWSPAEMGARYEQLARRIVAFTAHVRARRARFKLGQDERDDVFADISAALAGRNQTELLQWMQQSNAWRGKK